MEFKQEVFKLLEEIKRQIVFKEPISDLDLSFSSNIRLGAGRLESVDIWHTILKHLEERGVLSINSFTEWQPDAEIPNRIFNYVARISVDEATFTKEYSLLKDPNTSGELTVRKHKDRYLVTFRLVDGAEYSKAFRKNTNVTHLLDFLIENRGKVFLFSELNKKLKVTKVNSSSTGQDPQRRVRDTVKTFCDGLGVKSDYIFIKDNGYGLRSDIKIILPSN